MRSIEPVGVFILVGFTAFWLWLLREQPWDQKGPLILGLIAITTLGVMCSSGGIDFAEECDRFGC